MIVREATPTDSAEIAKVHVDTWRSTYRGIVSDEVLDGLSYERRQQMWDSVLTTHSTGNHIYVVESDAGNIAGFVSAGLEREERNSEVGEVYELYLLKEYQGRGWGRLLLRKAAERFSQEGHQSLMLWALADNPTRGFYEAMGGTVAREKEIEIGGDKLLEVAYVWKRIDDLVP